MVKSYFSKLQGAFAAFALMHETQVRTQRVHKTASL